MNARMWAFYNRELALFQQRMVYALRQEVQWVFRLRPNRFKHYTVNADCGHFYTNTGSMNTWGATDKLRLEISEFVSKIQVVSGPLRITFVNEGGVAVRAT